MEKSVIAIGPEAVNTVFVVDDDEAVRDSLRILLTTAGYRAELFDSARAFLQRGAAADEGCLLSDIRMSDMDGLELQEELLRRGNPIPVIIMTGHGDVPLAVRAMKAGAVDFLEKPFNRAQMLASIGTALARARHVAKSSAAQNEARSRLDKLSQREREVFDLLLTGMQSKTIAYKLGISPRTIEVHRSRIMMKLGTTSLQELVRLDSAARDPEAAS